tara:strand:- start:1588 stop:2034 length:447 start_codon:yes stop_codon:yes gene_type:complete
MNSSFKSDVETFAQKISQNDAAFLHAIFPDDKEHPKRCGVPLSPAEYADTDSALSGRMRGTASCDSHKWGSIGPKSKFRGRTKPSPFNFANKVDKYSPPWGCALTAAHFQECNEPNTGKDALKNALQSLIDKKKQKDNEDGTKHQRIG